MIFKNTISKVALCTSVILLLSACSLTEQPKTIVEVKEENVCMNPKGQIIDCPKDVERFTDSQLASASNSSNVNKPQANSTNATTMFVSHDATLNSHSLTGSQHSVLLSEYIEQISAGLIANVSNKAEHVIVGVTSFVDFTSDLATITPVGNIVSEHFTTHLFQHGFTVADYKVKNTVSITPQGDFVFTRDANKLTSSESITHVLTGTVMYQQTGLLINARVVDFENKWIISTASGFIPYFVLDTIIPNGAKHTVL
ncbi:FlgO family outer membrane protein [Psychrosphaera sp.]|nr:FlgO family outer membrane protein [Psychrosphaera sp.]